SFFFFSSRRRHTRSKRDWSSDMCSSDLAPWVMEKPTKAFARPGEVFDTSIGWRFVNQKFAGMDKMTYSMPETAEEVAKVFNISRSEERRVGEEWKHQEGVRRGEGKDENS